MLSIVRSDKKIDDIETAKRRFYFRPSYELGNLKIRTELPLCHKTVGKERVYTCESLTCPNKDWITNNQVFIYSSSYKRKKTC